MEDSFIDNLFLSSASRARYGEDDNFENIDVVYVLRCVDRV